MTFSEFRGALRAHIKAMLAGNPPLFVVGVDKDVLWNTYLDSFPKEKNGIFRERREFDCSACRHFVKSFGNVVTIKNNTVVSIWDFTTNDDTYQPVISALSKLLHSYPISDPFVTKDYKFGVEKNFDAELKVTWEHLYTEIPTSYIYRGHDTLDTVTGQLRDTRNVFKRSLDELSLESLDIVLELIASNTLYKGNEWQSTLKEFRKYKERYMLLSDSLAQENFAWELSASVGPVLGRIRNHSIGTLLINLSEGMDVDTAVRKYEAVVAPSNYKRPQAIFTQKMLEDAKKQLEAAGYMPSLGRRYATLDDITLPNILFANRDATSRIQGGDVFDELAGTSSKSRPKNFDRVEEVSIDDFVSKVLPSATSVEAYLENKHSGNLVSLIAPKDKSAPSMFKWNNPFSWAYAGNITDSMKERVKAAGGKVDGVLRFSIQWNEENDCDNDFDAHAIQPDGYELYYMNRQRPIPSTGELDVDIVYPRGAVAVENITWARKDRMPLGTYKFFVKNFNHRGGRSGFRAEIEFDGQIYSFNCNRDVRQSENVYVAEVTLNKDGTFTIKELLPSTTTSRKMWGLDSNNFHPVTVVMNSPNYWDAQDGIGHKHFFFMLKDCVNTEGPNGFFNEFLKEDMMKHKRVLEALGGKMRVEDVADQLSGIGFSATKRDSLIVKVTGATSRVLKVNF